MDIKAYIESGQLEAYASGLCSDLEAKEVEKLCAQYSELKTELESIQKSLESLANVYAKSPPPMLKESIFKKIENEIPMSAMEDETKIISLYSRVRKLAIAAAAMFIFSLAINVILFNRWNKANETITALNSEKSSLALEMNTTRVKQDNMSRDMAMMSDPSTMKVLMKGMEKSPSSMAIIYWNKKSGSVLLSVNKLPTPEQGMQYQLWAIVDGKPVDAGMIVMDSTMQRMKSFDNSQAFAVTLEKEGGSATPTMAEMYVMGAVSL